MTVPAVLFPPCRTLPLAGPREGGQRRLPSPGRTQPTAPCPHAATAAYHRPGDPRVRQTRTLLYFGLRESRTSIYRIRRQTEGQTSPLGPCRPLSKGSPKGTSPCPHPAPHRCPPELPSLQGELPRAHSRPGPGTLRWYRRGQVKGSHCPPSAKQLSAQRKPQAGTDPAWPPRDPLPPTVFRVGGSPAHVRAAAAHLLPPHPTLPAVPGCTTVCPTYG